MKLSAKEVTAFQVQILSWYETHKRDLPWRKAREPYKILVSEVMLQQTQASRVIPKYEAWLKEFPTIEALARAATADVLRLWLGLGYNRRALYLQRTARILAARSRHSQSRGMWPKTVDELVKLPGIGRYTAGAVACFAFNEQVAVVDTNIRKVILTKFQIPNTKSQKEIQEIADVILPSGKAYEWNQALMDYASAMLKREKIPIPKQGKFAGSNRYYRGKLLRILLEREKVAKMDIGKLLKEDFTDEDTAWLDAILSGMEKDSLIVIKKNDLRLKNS